MNRHLYLPEFLRGELDNREQILWGWVADLPRSTALTPEQSAWALEAAKGRVLRASNLASALEHQVALVKQTGTLPELLEDDDLRGELQDGAWALWEQRLDLLDGDANLEALAIQLPDLGATLAQNQDEHLKAMKALDDRAEAGADCFLHLRGQDGLSKHPWGPFVEALASRLLAGADAVPLDEVLASLKSWHPGDAGLVKYSFGELSPQTHALVEAHLETCQSCKTLAEALTFGLQQQLPQKPARPITFATAKCLCLAAATPAQAAKADELAGAIIADGHAIFEDGLVRVGWARDQRFPWILVVEALDPNLRLEEVSLEDPEGESLVMGEPFLSPISWAASIDLNPGKRSQEAGTGPTLVVVSNLGTRVLELLLGD
jgi:hypothetical protein